MRRLPTEPSLHPVVATVVFAGALQREAASCSACWPVPNFFASPANPERWLAQRGKLTGETISMREPQSSRPRCR